MKRIEFDFESHITREIYWAFNVLLIFSSNTNKTYKYRKSTILNGKYNKLFILLNQ